MTIPQLVFLLYKLILEFPCQLSEMPSSYYDEYLSRGSEYPICLRNQQVRLSEEQVLLVESLFKDWFLFRESIYNASAIEDCKEKSKNINPFKVIANIDINQITPEYKLGQKSFAGYISLIQDKIKEWEDVLSGESIKNYLEDFQQLLLAIYDFEYPSFYDETFSGLQSIGQILGTVCPEFPSWKECHQLHVSLNKSCRKYIDENDELYILDFRQKHDLLLCLGTYNENSAFQKIMELIKWFRQIDKHLAQEELKIENQVQLLGFKAFTKIDSLTISGNERFSLREQLVCLLVKSQQIEEMKIHINTLAIAIRYVDESLLNEVQHISVILKSIKENFLSYDFTERLNELIGKCQLYSECVQSLQENTNMFLKNNKLKSLETSYEDLHNGMLKENLLALLDYWDVHLSTIYTLLDAILNEDDHRLNFYEGTRKSVSYTISLSNVSLVNHISQVIGYTAKKVPSLEQVKGLYSNLIDAQYTWIIDAFLHTYDCQEIILSQQRGQELVVFINTFPKLNGKLVARLAVK